MQIAKICFSCSCDCLNCLLHSYLLPSIQECGGAHNFLLCLKVETTTPNSQSFNSFPISHSCFCLIFVKVDIVFVLVDLCRIMGVVVSTLNNGKIGT